MRQIFFSIIFSFGGMKDILFLINKFPIALLTHDFLRLVWRVGRDDLLSTLSTGSLKEFSMITLQKSLMMTYVWMFLRQRNAIFYIKCEFLFYYFKRLP
jgi:hypothetical protein